MAKLVVGENINNGGENEFCWDANLRQRDDVMQFC